MKLQKLSIFLAENNLQKARFAQVIGVSPSRISIWLKKEDMYCAVDHYANVKMVRMVTKFKIDDLC